MSESSRSSLQQYSTSVAAGLNPYTGTWDRRRAAHLVRRTCFGAIKREVDLALAGGSADAAVARILSDATSAPLPDPPAWYNGSSSASDIERIYDVQRRWFEAMRVPGLSEKMTLFWHNHFVIQYPSLMQKAPGAVPKLCYDYLTLIRLNALGNLKSFVRAIGTNPAMLVYLDGFVNEKGAANENYGRELLELFTMGQFAPDGAPNYTESDIKEIARALTGYVVTSSGGSYFEPNRFDDGTKSFFGQTGSFDYDDVVDILFEVRGAQIAHYICRKLYCFFVQPVPDEAFVAELASTFVASGFEIAPVLETLFTSAHFLDGSYRAARIKSPVELLVGFVREAELVGRAGRDLDAELAGAGCPVVDARGDGLPVGEVRQLHERPERERRVGEGEPLGVVGLAAGGRRARRAGVVAGGVAALGGVGRGRLLGQRGAGGEQRETEDEEAERKGHDSWYEDGNEAEPRRASGVRSHATTGTDRFPW